jgi:DNA (cytosine-5)-methyltransferase 1
MENPDSVGVSIDAGRLSEPPAQIPGVPIAMRSLELFAGAGGLALGISKAGFVHTGVVEWDRDACTAMQTNKHAGAEHIRDWPIMEADVREIGFSQFGDDIDLLAGGVPCQPWSQAGKHRGQNDRRNLFPEMIRAVRETRPKAVLVENVKGLLRQAFSNYFEYIVLGLSYPELTAKPQEAWERHLRRLEQHHSSKRTSGLEYNVAFRLLNAADYGVPQKRERVFLVAFRGDINAEWSFPDASHSMESLASAKWQTSEYWERHSIPSRLRPSPTSRDLAAIRRTDLFTANRLPWRTVRDALHGLPEPGSRGAKRWHNHTLVEGARAYPGHTGSPLDEPSKTLKAGDHGVPGGENTVVLTDGSMRYYSVREAARMQCFPDDYVFPGVWTESMRQLGNAVPVALAEIIANSIRQHLSCSCAKKGSRSAA